MYFIMSDIHGCYKQMIEALSHWDSGKEHLVIMGDLIDRGPDSLKVVRKAMELTKTHPGKVTVLKGNHEEMFTNWLLDTDDELLGIYYTETHEETLKSFMGDEFKKRSRRQRAEFMKHNFINELNFMKGGTLHYKETDNIIFIHAGINLEADNWRFCRNDMLWIRNEFIYSSKKPEERVFFGHTPIRLMHKDSNSIWISDCGNKVGIDGGVSMGGHLNALKVDELGNIVEKFEIK